MFLFGLVIGLAAGFALGWAARRDDARHYLESRERYWRGLLAEALAERDDAVSAVRLEPVAPAQTVVHVHVAAASPGVWQSSPAIDAEVVRELAGGAA